MDDRANDLIAALLGGRREELEAANKAVLASRRRCDRGLVGRVEAQVAASPSSAIAFDASGLATVSGAGRSFCGGRFALRSIGELAGALPLQASSRPRQIRFSTLLGASPLTDIGALQAFSAPKSLFQVASQFNCLEAPHAAVVPVAEYLHDPTQGPRAAISAFPGALVRHYAAPAAGDERFVQSQARQVDLLAKALPAKLGRVRSGYLTLDSIADLTGTARALEERFEDLQIGVHDEVEVVFGCDWDGAVDGPRRIAQVLTSTFAGGSYSRGARIAGDLEVVCRQLLRAAYLGTLLAAAALGKRAVVLTMIGGGVFGNPHALIWESILWALDEAERRAPSALEVVLNARLLGEDVSRTAVASECQQRGGVLVDLG